MDDDEWMRLHHSIIASTRSLDRPWRLRTVAAMPAPLIRPAVPADAPACINLRGRTRQNAISAAQLATWGITAASWAEGIRSGATPGHVASQGDALAGYCFGDRGSGEVLVLALLPTFEGRGLGRELLAHVVQQLAGAGHTRLFLGCSTDPASRSHGFYRRLGWTSTGQLDGHGDEILELHLPAPG
jgi:GNAT superfamily N-acetyltransferase